MAMWELPAPITHPQRKWQLGYYYKELFGELYSLICIIRDHYSVQYESKLEEIEVLQVQNRYFRVCSFGMFFTVKSVELFNFIRLLKCLNRDLGLLVGFNSSLPQLAWDWKAMLLLLIQFHKSIIDDKMVVFQPTLSTLLCAECLGLVWH